MPTMKSFQKLRKKRFAQRKTADREARLDSKSEAITPEMLRISFPGKFKCELPKDPTSLAETLAREQRYFENPLTSAELERFSHQTVVGIGPETRGRNGGCYPLVLNLLKTLHDGVPGLGFPGGRVRLGETPTARLLKEYLEESGLVSEVVNPDQPPVAKHLVGEEGHEFLAYEVRVVSGKPKPAFTKGEQIVAVVFVDETLLAKVCRTDGRMTVKGFGLVGVLRSHRLVFLEYLRKKEARKRAETPQTTSVEEAANV